MNIEEFLFNFIHIQSLLLFVLDTHLQRSKSGHCEQ